MFQCAVHITDHTNHEKKKPPCLNRIRQCGLFFSLDLRAYSFESASYFYSFVCRCVRSKIAHSQIDKFNHVKYTNSLSVRNWFTQIRRVFLRGTRPTHISLRSKRDRDAAAAHPFTHARRHARAWSRTILLRRARPRIDDICQPKNRRVCADFRRPARPNNPHCRTARALPSLHRCSAFRRLGRRVFSCLGEHARRAAIDRRGRPRCTTRRIAMR